MASTVTAEKLVSTVLHYVVTAMASFTPDMIEDNNADVYDDIDSADSLTEATEIEETETEAIELKRL